VKEIQEYKWSSYTEYIGKEKIVDIDFTLDIFNFDSASDSKKYKSLR
jgi:putative transposase